MYESTIDFTFDTICPWTYLAKKRLDEAIRIVTSTDAAQKVNFTIKFLPYQLYPKATPEGEDKYEWYKRSRYGDSEEKMKMYMTLMTAYGVSADIDFKFHGTVANTLNAHRVIQHFQETAGAETTDKIVMSLYRQYFTEEKHPSAPETLMQACKDAGVDDGEAGKVIADESEGLRETKSMIQEQESNGVDSVPFVLIEGRRRDVSLQGAQEVGGYVKALEKIVKESG